MPSQAEHETQAAHNRSLLSVINPEEYPDWYSIVGFYTALHLVEAYFAESSGGDFHCTSHYDREHWLKESYPRLYGPYRQLAAQAEVARYGCKPLSFKGVGAWVDRKLEATDAAIAHYRANPQ